MTDSALKSLHERVVKRLRYLQHVRWQSMAVRDVLPQHALHSSTNAIFSEASPEIGKFEFCTEKPIITQISNYSASELEPPCIDSICKSYPVHCTVDISQETKVGSAVHCNALTYSLMPPSWEPSAFNTRGQYREGVWGRLFKHNSKIKIKRLSNLLKQQQGEDALLHCRWYTGIYWYPLVYCVTGIRCTFFVK